MRLTPYQPGIPQNGGAVLRLDECLGVEADLIKPFGFLWDDRRLRRTEMHYLDPVKPTQHRPWATLDAARGNARLVLLTTQGCLTKAGFRFAPGDILMLRRESSGVRGDVHAQADQRLAVPMAGGLHSLNVNAIALGKALHQTDGFPAIGLLETTP